MLSEEQAAAPALPHESAGMKLARARESLEMSVADVARALRLSVKQIEALEADKLEALPGRTFLRGFVRNYARLLRLDPDQLVAEYLPEQSSEKMMQIQAPSQQISFSEHHEKPWLKWLAGAFVVIALASWGILSWLGPVPSKPEVVAKAPVQDEPPASEPDGDAPQTLLPVAPVAIAPPADSAEVPAQPAVVQPPPAPAPLPASTGIPLSRLELGFSGTAWVEVLDKHGNKIHSQNNPAGTQRILEGEPPLSLVIGSAPNVRLTWKGQPVDLSTHTKADVARLTLE